MTRCIKCKLNYMNVTILLIKTRPVYETKKKNLLGKKLINLVSFNESRVSKWFKF